MAGAAKPPIEQADATPAAAAAVVVTMKERRSKEEEDGIEADIESENAVAPPAIVERIKAMTTFIIKDMKNSKLVPTLLLVREGGGDEWQQGTGNHNPAQPYADG